MQNRLSKFPSIIVSMLFVLTCGFGCGGDETAGQDVRTGTVTGTVTLVGADDFSDITVSVDERTTTTDVDGFY